MGQTGGCFLKIFTKDPLGIGQANCFRTHNEPCWVSTPLPPVSTNGDPLGPKDLREHLAPLRFITFASLDDGFANVEMLGLYDAVGSGIVARNLDVTDTVARCQNVEGGNIGRGIVGDELFKTTPATEDVLEDEVCDDLSRVRGSSTTFRIGGESVVSVVDVAIGTELRHKKGINVSLAKQRRDGGNNRGNMKILGLAQLTLMTSTGVPTNILIEVGPPEMQEKVASGCEHSFVSQVVVGIPDKSETLFRKGNKLRDTFAIPAKHQSICEEVV